jgi:hypothetical protein
VYGGTMVNLTGVVHPDPPATEKPLTKVETEEDGLAIHAGLGETSQTLYVRPDLVESAHKDARPITADSWDDYETLPNAKDWPGYFGSPRLARTDIGADQMNVSARNASDLALRIIAGLDTKSLERIADGQNPAILRLEKIIVDRASDLEQQQQEWMRANGIQ